MNSSNLTAKKIVSFIVFAAAAVLVAFIIQNLGDRKYQRGDYQNPTLAPADDSSDLGPTADDIETELYGAQSNAAFQTSLLATLRGPRPSSDQIASQQAAVIKSQAALVQAESDAYLSSKDAVHTTDSFLDVNDQINATHQEMLDILSSWKGDIDSGTPPTSDTVNSYLSSIQSDLNDLQTLVNDLVPQNPGLTQAQIDSYKADVESAISQINQTIDDLSTAQAAANTAQNDLTTDQSIGDPTAINNQADTVVEAEAKVSDLEDQLSQVTPPSSSDSQNDSPETIIQNDNSINDPSNAGIKINPDFDPTKPQLIQN